MEGSAHSQSKGKSRPYLVKKAVGKMSASVFRRKALLFCENNSSMRIWELQKSHCDRGMKGQETRE